MNNSNLKILETQIFGTGFSNGFTEQLQEKSKDLPTDFSIIVPEQYDGNFVNYELKFEKSETSDLYFFNQYTAILPKEGINGSLQQNFRLFHPKEKILDENGNPTRNRNVTKKEAYNLLSGRSVNKLFLDKDKSLMETWVKLNFDKKTANGGFEMTRYFPSQFNFEDTIAKYPLKNLLNTDDKNKLFDSLKRGNIQKAVFLVDGKETKIQMEVAVKFKSFNFFDEKGNSLTAADLKNILGEDFNLSAQKGFSAARVPSRPTEETMQKATILPPPSNPISQTPESTNIRKDSQAPEARIRIAVNKPERRRRNNHL